MTGEEARRLPAGTPVVYRDHPATLIDVGVAVAPGGARIDIIRVHSPRFGVRVAMAHEVSGRAPAPATTGRTR